MKNIFLTFVLIFSFVISANLPENFSKYQSNFIFECDEPEKCFAAFDKYMSAPEVAGLEVDFNFTFSYRNFSNTIVTVNPVVPLTHYDYEVRLNEENLTEKQRYCLYSSEK